jgi:hypothetical protein
MERPCLKRKSSGGRGEVAGAKVQVVEQGPEHKPQYGKKKKKDYLCNLLYSIPF